MARPTARSGGDSLKHGRGAPVENWIWDQLSGIRYQPSAPCRPLKQNFYRPGTQGDTEEGRRILFAGYWLMAVDRQLFMVAAATRMRGSCLTDWRKLRVGIRRGRENRFALRA